MNKRNKSLIIFVLIFSILTAIFFGYSLARIIIRPSTNNNLSENNNNEYNKLYSFLEANHYEGFVADKAEFDQLQAICKSLNDPYTYIEREMITVVIPKDPNNDPGKPAPQKITEEFTGVGIQFVYDEETGEILITDLMENGAALKQGLYPGDKIISLKTKEMPNELNFKEDKSTVKQISEILKSVKLNEEVTFRVKRPDKSEKLINVSSTTFKFSKVKSGVIDNKTAYLKIDDFTEGVDELFIKHFNELKESVLNKNDATLILDLRNNPGGNLNVLDHIAKHLLINKEIYKIQSTKKQSSKYIAKGGLTEKLKFNIKVLVNKNTASAAEVLACALYYTGGYKVYGDETFGKNVYQNKISSFPKVGYALTYTEGYWYYCDNIYNKGKTPVYKKISKENPIPVIKLENKSKFDIDIPIYREINEKDLPEEQALYKCSRIIFLQKYLDFLYDDLNIIPTGFIDKQTQEALKRFQRENDLTETGKYNLDTAIKLYQNHKNDKLNFKDDLQIKETKDK